MPWIEILLRLLVSAVITMLIAGMSFLLGFFLWRLLRVKADRFHAIRLENQGNCRSMYYITIDSPEPALDFSILLNNIPLPTVGGLEEETADGVSTAQAGEVSSGNQGSTTSSGTSAVAAAGQSVSSKAGRLASFLGSLGALLPGSVGNALKSQASQVRTIQTSSMRAARAPDAMRRQVKSLGGKRNVPGGQPGKFVVGQKVVHAVSERAFSVQTPEVGIGQSIALTLKVGSREKRYPQGSFPYILHIRQVALDFPDLSANEILRNGSVHFRPIYAWRYWLPTFFVSLLALISATALVYSYLRIWF